MKIYLKINYCSFFFGGGGEGGQLDFNRNTRALDKKGRRSAQDRKILIYFANNGRSKKAELLTRA